MDKYKELATFAEPYILLVKEDVDSLFVGKNLRGDYVLGVVRGEGDHTIDVFIYFIGAKSQIKLYFDNSISLYELGEIVNDVLIVGKTINGKIVYASKISKEEWRSEFTDLNYIVDDYFNFEELDL